METSSHDEHRPEVLVTDETVGEAARMLGRISHLTHGLSEEQLRELIIGQEGPGRVSRTIFALRALNDYLFPRTAGRIVDNRQWFEQKEQRLLRLHSTKGSVGQQFASYAILDAARFDLEGQRSHTVSLPVEDMFEMPTGVGVQSNAFQIYPGLATYFLKAVVGPDNEKRRAIIDLLTDDQIVQLVGYACAINRDIREVNAIPGNLDMQTKRLLMHLGGKGDDEIQEDEGRAAKDTSHLRRSRRLLVGRLQQYGDLLLAQASGMAGDPEGHQIFEYDELAGVRLASEIKDILAMMVKPSRKLTPLDMVESAMRRYAANTLIERQTTSGSQAVDMSDVKQTLNIIWMLVNGLNAQEVVTRTGAPLEMHKAAFAALGRSVQHELPLSKPFWREVRSLMDSAKSTLPPPSQHPKESHAPKGRPSPRGLITTSKVEVPDTQLGPLHDRAFRARIAQIVADGQLNKFMKWGRSQPAGWVKDMSCGNDPESLALKRGQSKVSDRIVARCVQCPVRQVCLAVNIGMPKHRHGEVKYMYAGYTPQELEDLKKQAL